MDSHEIAVRSARDRIIDLIGIGDTYPLTDLNVVADQLKVAFGGTAKIPIEQAQAGVIYQLCDPKGQPLGDQFKAQGANATLVIETPKVLEDLTYRVQVTKLPGAVLPAQLPRFLDEGAPVKVGIDSRLSIDFPEGTLLDPTVATAQSSDPRIIPYGSSLSVRVNGSQEGVDYILVIDGRELKDVVRTGNLGAITLPTVALFEDAVVQVRATKNFAPSENRQPETTLLDAKLYLKVMANPLPTVLLDAAIVDYRGDTTLKIANTQASVKYRVYVRAIPDADFIRSAASGDVVTVPVTGKPSVQVLNPRSSPSAELPAGFVPLEGPAQAGNGAELKFPLKSLAADSLYLVQAVKEHRVDPVNPASKVILSSVRLMAGSVALIRPDPARALNLRVPFVAGKTGTTLQVGNGEPGVFYYWRIAPAGAELPLPTYFHKRDEQDPLQNKGIGQLGMEVDFAVAADNSAGAAGNRATTYPLPPQFTIDALPADTRLSIRAVKAQTGIETAMAAEALLAAVPNIRAEQAVIDRGAAAKILIPASSVDDRYQLTLQGQAVREAVAGNAAQLALLSDPLTSDQIFEVVVRRPAQALAVDRVVAVAIAVRPDATLP